MYMIMELRLNPSLRESERKEHLMQISKLKLHFAPELA